MSLISSPNACITSSAWCCWPERHQSVLCTLPVVSRLGQIPKECKGHQDGESACEFWRKHGATLAPHLKPVAQAVLGIPASSAVVERDFCIDGRGFSRKNGSLVDPAFAEMLLLLRAAYDDIPDDIPPLTTGEAMAAIPDRLKEAGALEEVDALDSPESPSQNGPDETQEDNDDDGEEEDLDNFLSTGSFEAAGSQKNGGSIDTGSTKTCVDPACKFASKVSECYYCCCRECGGYMGGFCCTGVGEEAYGQQRVCGNFSRM